MNNTNIPERAKVKKGRVKTGERTETKSGISIGTIIASGLVAAFFGTWALAGLISGLVESGGPLSFLQSWFTAVFG